MEIAILFMLFTKHLFADFFWQYPWHWENKGTYGHPGGIHHATIHGLCSLIIGMVAIVMPASRGPDVDGTAFAWFIFLAIVALPIVDGVVHYHMDWFKTRHCNRKGYFPGKNVEWYHWLGVDQYVHALTYLGMTWALSSLL